MNWEIIVHDIGKPVLFAMTIGFVIMFVLNKMEISNDRK